MHKQRLEFALAALLLTLVGCGDDDSNTIDATVADGSIQDGAAFDSGAATDGAATDAAAADGAATDGAATDGAATDAAATDAAATDAAAMDATSVNAMTPTFAVTVTTTGTGAGGVIAEPSVATSDGIDCGLDCTGQFDEGSTVTLEARPTAGTGPHFLGWSGDCAGSFHDCTLTVDAAKSVTAAFAVQTHNLVFTTSTTHNGNLGGLAGADAICAARASEAGLTGTYVAYLSDASSSALSRLGSARGWIRVDGAPFADEPADFLSPGFGVFNALPLDERGAQLALTSVWTGTGGSGATTGNTCDDWSDTLATGTTGQTHYGAWRLLGGGVSSCFLSVPLYCFGTDLTTALVPSASGKKVFVTASTVAADDGIDGFDAACEAAKPGGVGTYKALVSTTTVAASAVLSAGTTYVRLDGVVVGTGSEIASRELRSGIWQNNDGDYVNAGNPYVWTGSATPGAPGTTATTCSDWSVTSEFGMAGDFFTITSEWWASALTPCSQSLYVYCVEQ